ncbi:exosortase U [Rubritalea marina]|uniref:exosortase U n=1 Tax=Rubritalea marina TaxID=361055 RepID=UPI00037E7637|nr:exosortase U [Rubritalea marina]
MESQSSTSEAKNWGFQVLCALLLISLVPVLIDHFADLWARSHYKWFPVLICIVLGLLYKSWKNSEVAQFRPRPWALCVGYTFCLALAGVAYLYFTGWVAMVTSIFVIGLMLAELNGRKRMPRAFAIWSLLFLLVRVPHQVERRFLTLFQGLSSKGASPAIDYAGHYHVFQGKVLVIDGYEIDISGICNGPFSLIGMVALAAVMAVVMKRSLIQGILLMLFGVVAAAFVNILRITAVGVVYASYGVDIMTNIWEYVLLVGSYALGVILLFSMDALLVFLFTPVGEEKPNKYGKSLARVWDRLTELGPMALMQVFRKSTDTEGGRIPRWSIAILSVALLCFGGFGAPVLYYQYGFGDYQTYFMHDKSQLAIIEPELVRFDRDNWTLIGIETEERPFASLWGAYSFIWRLRYHDTLVIMALDYPFDKWHDVKVCYGRLGWQASSERLEPFKRYIDWGASETEMTLPTGDFGFILCSHCDHEGNVVQPKPTDHRFDMVMYYLHPKQWAAPYGVSVDRNKNTFYQTQAMVTTPFALDEPTKQEIRLMYEEFREQTRLLIQQETRDAQSL